MGVTVVSNDTFAARVGLGEGSVQHAASSKVAFDFFDKTGLVVAVGRGETDTDITYLEMKNADGETCYVYPNANQDGILVSGTKP